MDSSDQAAPSAESPSLGDRIANIFGPEAKQAPPQPNKPEPQDAAPAATDETSGPDVAASEDAAPDGEPSETAPQFEEVDWDGERFQVPPKLKEAISKASDYTKKTQEVAEQRRLLEYEQKKLQSSTAERKFAESVKDELSTLASIDQRLAQYRNVNVSELSDRDLSLMRLEVDRLKELKSDTERALDGKYREFNGAQQKALDDLMREGREIIRKNIPNFNEAVAKDIADTARSMGYSDEEIAGSLDPRFFKLAYEAAQFRKLQASRSATKAVIQQAKPIGKASPTNPMPSAVKDQLNYRKALERAGPRGSQARQNIAKDRIAAIFGK